MNKILFSKKSDNWATPKIFNYWATFDPCPLKPNFDGLSIKWHGKILLNPPYSSIRIWIEKAIKEIPNVKCLTLLLPARTDTKWFHELIYNKYAITFIPGRLKFGDCKNSAPFPSMLVYLKYDY